MSKGQRRDDGFHKITVRPKGGLIAVLSSGGLLPGLLCPGPSIGLALLYMEQAISSAEGLGAKREIVGGLYIKARKD